MKVYIFIFKIFMLLILHWNTISSTFVEKKKKTITIQTGQGLFDYQKRRSVLGSCLSVGQENLSNFPCNVNPSYVR